MQSMPPRPIVIKDLFNIAKKLHDLKWEPFRAGVRIHRLYGNQKDGPSAALLWYDAQSGVPHHEHLGYEHILILSQSQSDENGENQAGTLVINAPGSTHSVAVGSGAVVLAIWERPIRVAGE